MTRLPMFPLGNVVFPFTAVPLRVFEPRYQALLDLVLAGDRRFGIVLIERGFEVGGGDHRFDAGTMVEVVASQDLDDGHRAIVVAGIQPIRVTRWLEDDPHPWAEVAMVELSAAPDSGRLEEASRRLERVLTLASELGADVFDGLDLEVSDDPLAAAYQLAALTPTTPLDHQRLIESPDATTMLELMAGFLDEQAEMLQARLAGG
ncbi:MAG: LON peptidase substrate-binding domain-containing protein [Acidimicrobiia bacterium]